MVSLPLVQGLSAVQLCGSGMIARKNKSAQISIESLESAAAHSNNWRLNVRSVIRKAGER